MKNENRENLLQKFVRFNKTVEENISTDMSIFKKSLLFLDFVYEYRFHGVYLLDYIQYDFYAKKAVDRRKYVVHGKLLELMRTCNNPKHRHYFDQKNEFDRKFAKFLHRDWLDTRTATLEEFRKFLYNKNSFFLKQPDGMFGTGVERVDVNSIKNVEAYFSKIKKANALCEETLTQCKEMEEFNNSSINTLRVVSILQGDGHVKIMGGLLRVGRKGKIADNFHHQGICAFIDPATGIVCTTGVDKNNKRYVIHPDSQKAIVGFKVPIWDQIVRTVTEAAHVIPDMRYIGWDVVITKDYEVALVEGNSGADPDAEQITTKEGRWPYYEECLKEIRKLKKNN